MKVMSIKTLRKSKLVDLLFLEKLPAFSPALKTHVWSIQKCTYGALKNSLKNTLGPQKIHSMFLQKSTYGPTKNSLKSPGLILQKYDPTLKNPCLVLPRIYFWSSYNCFKPLNLIHIYDAVKNSKKIYV